MSKQATTGVRKLIAPAAVSAAGAAVGWVLTRKPKQLRAALPELPDVSVGELTDDLRGRVESALGRGGGGDGRAGQRSSSRDRRRLSPEQLEARRQKREQRRTQRRQRTKT